MRNCENIAGTASRPSGASENKMKCRKFLSSPDVSPTISGMRKIRDVEANLAARERGALSGYAPAYLPPAWLGELRKHRRDSKLNPETFAGKLKHKVRSFLPTR